MKKWAIFLFILAVLSGCSAESEVERGMALRSSLLQAESTSFLAEISAEYGNTSYDFSLECSFDRQGNMDFTVIAPESIVGIRGSVLQDGGRLKFDDTALFFDLQADGQLSPVSAPWILMKTLRSGYLSSACTEEDYLLLSIDDSYADDALNLDIRIDSTGAPVHAEILYDGRRILSVAVKNFVIM